MVQAAEDVEFRINVYTPGTRWHEQRQVLAFLCHHNGGLPGVFLPLYRDGKGHQQAIGWPWLCLFDDRRQTIVLSVRLDCDCADTQLRRSRPCDPLLEDLVHVFASRACKSALQCLKPGTVEEVVTVKQPQGADETLVAHLLAQHVKKHQRLTIADGCSGRTVTRSKGGERYVAVGCHIVGILLQRSPSV